MIINLPPDSVVIGTKYYFSDWQGNNHFAGYRKRGGTLTEYITRANSGYVQFSRRDNSVASGIFAYTAYRPNGDSVVITDGRFDISHY
jgi:hypothetical protein